MYFWEKKTKNKNYQDIKQINGFFRFRENEMNS